MTGELVHLQVRKCVVRLSCLFPVNEIAILLDISPSTICRIIDLFEATGLYEPPKLDKVGRRQIFDASDSDVRSPLPLYLEGVLTIENGQYLDELQDIMIEQTGKTASVSTISRQLKRLGLSNKQVTKAAAERSQELRAEYYAEIGLLYETEQLVFTDECYIDKRATGRTRGWSKVSTRAPAIAPFYRGRRYTILPALSLNGILDCRIFKGSCNSKIFYHFIEDLLLEMNPFPMRNSVLVLDNVSFHHDPHVEAIAEERGIRLVFLPPYSPDYNPIEEGFAGFKAWVKRNNMLVRKAMEAEDPDEAINLLTYAVSAAMTSETARGWFSDSGYF